MMKRFLVLSLILMFAPFAFANVAVDELNTLLLKKEAAKHSIKKQSPEIKDLATHYYLVFIYKSTCPHCHKFAPILEDFSNSFHIKVRSYSLDNEPLEGFSANPLTPELFQTFYASGGYKPVVPALFLVNRQTLEAYAVLFGQASAYQLARRVHELKQHIEEKFRE